VNANGEVNVFQALADPTRHAIFQRLKEGPVAVGELADGLPVSRPAVSQHLRVLKDAGLVSERREGTRRVYRIEPQGVWALRESIDRMWEDALEAFRVAAEREGREEQ
jgi:DNA-binding transcriptional ArsR family regulator